MNEKQGERDEDHIAFSPSFREMTSHSGQLKQRFSRYMNNTKYLSAS